MNGRLAKRIRRAVEHQVGSLRAPREYVETNVGVVKIPNPLHVVGDAILGRTPMHFMARKSTLSLPRTHPRSVYQELKRHI